MITGDNPLTACHVAEELHFIEKAYTLILQPPSEKGEAGHSTGPPAPSNAHLLGAQCGQNCVERLVHVTTSVRPS
jgi:magnesium-transporting ATPase (P-type)